MTTPPNPSPRPRGLSRPLPFTLAMPVPPSGASFDFDNFTNNTPSHPPSPSYFRQTCVDVAEVLYGNGGRDKEAVERLVEDYYDLGATFENPVTMAKGKAQISELFCLLRLVPGEFWSELGEIAESRSYDGTRLMVMTHTLNIALLPFLSTTSPSSSSEYHQSFTSLHRMSSFYSYSSVPSTPYHHPPALLSHPSQSLTTHQHPASSSSKSHWPISSFLRTLTPLRMAETLTKLNIKIHTRLVFNELGRISHHEDVIGIKETVEGIPLLAQVYALNRQGVGFLASTASRILLGRKKRKVEDEEERSCVDDGSVGSSGIGSIHEGLVGTLGMGGSSEGLGMNMGRMGTTTGLGSPIMIRSKSLGINSIAASETALTSVDLDEC